MVVVGPNNVHNTIKCTAPPPTGAQPAMLFPPDYELGSNYKAIHGIRHKKTVCVPKRCITTALRDRPNEGFSRLVLLLFCTRARRGKNYSCDPLDWITG